MHNVTAVALDRHEAPLGDEGPASVPRLPPELLHKIFACVAQIESPAYPKTSSARATLAVVSRSCSTFHSIALPLLWHSVDIRSRRDARSVARAIRVDETTQERASFVSEVRLRTEEMLGPPHEHATTDLCRLLDTVELLRVEQRWFGLELLGGFTALTHLYLLGPWVPSRTAGSDCLTRLQNLRSLGITLHALFDMLDPAHEAHEALVLFGAATTVSIHEASVSLASWLPPRRTARGRDAVFATSFPHVAVLSSPLAYKLELGDILATSGPSALNDDDDDVHEQRAKHPAVLWRVEWQSFVDYMPPYRQFALPHDVVASASSRNASRARFGPCDMIQHLAIAPLAYSPVPRHFLSELNDRIRDDPSLRLLETLLLDQSWGPDEVTSDCDVAGGTDGRVKVGYVAMNGQGFAGWESRVEAAFLANFGEL